MNDRTLNISSSLGDPRARSTWSGTPLNLCLAFEKNGIQVNAINAEPHIAVRAMIKLRCAVSGYGARSSARSGFRRKNVAHLIRNGLKGTSTGAILYTDSCQFPPLIQGNFRHYHFLDSTWEMWRKYESDTNRLTRKLIEEADRLDGDAYRLMDHIFSTSTAAKKSLVDHYKIPEEIISVVGTGTGSLAPYREEKDYRERSVLFVAKQRFSEKGGRLLLDAVSLARKKDPSIRLTIAGDDRYLTQFKNAPGITALGSVTLAELQSLFNRASLFALPAFNEPWGLVYLEALGCKTPILGLNRNAFPELSGEGKFGFIVDQPTPEHIADSIIEAFSDIPRLEKMGRSGQVHTLNSYSWDITAGKMLQRMMP